VTGLRYPRAAIAGALVAISLLPGVARAADIVIERPWSRATPPGATVGAGYLVIRNTGKSADRLVGAATPAAAMVQVHEIRMADGEMQMREVDDLEIPAGGSVHLEPGGLHLMLMDLVAPLVTGTTVPVTLEFAGAGRIPVKLPVAPPGAPGPAP